MAVPQVGVYAEELTDSAFETEAEILDDGKEEIEEADNGWIINNNQSSEIEYEDTIDWMLNNGQEVREGEESADDLEDEEESLVDNTLDFSGDENKNVFHGLYYREKEDGTICITGVEQDVHYTLDGKVDYKDKCWIKEIAIPSSIDGKVVNELSNSAFVNCNNLAKVVMPDTIIRIGSFCFQNCSSLKWMTFSNQLKTIGKGAFSSCEALDNIVIPKSLENVSYDYYLSTKSIFGGCTSLEHISFEKGSTRISCCICADCPSLKEIIVPEGVKQINERAFANCPKLSKIILPDSVERIGEYAFSGDISLEEVRLPEGLKSLGRAAFSDCSKLNHIRIPKNMERVEYEYYVGAHHVFGGCENLSDVGFEDGLERVPDYLFAQCKAIANVSMPDSIKRIGMGAFEGCIALNNISFSRNLDYIGRYAFNGCSKIETISLPTSLNSIGCSAFQNCVNLVKVFIPKSLKNFDHDYYIGSHSIFSGCTLLKTIEFEPGITRLMDFLFNNFSSLESIIIPNTVERIEERTFGSCTSLTTITLSNSVKFIGTSAFNGCSRLKDVYYNGSERQWKSIEVYNHNDELINAKIHFQENNSTNTFFTIVDKDNKPLSGVEVYHYGKGPFVSDDKGNVEVPSIGSTDELSSEDNNYSDYSLVLVKKGYRTKKYREFDLQKALQSVGDAYGEELISTESEFDRQVEFIDQVGLADQLDYVGTTEYEVEEGIDELLQSTESSIDELTSVDASATTSGSKFVMYKTVSKYNGEFYYLATGDASDAHVKCSYDDKYFSSSNAVYNHSLARMSFSLAMAAFNSSKEKCKAPNDKAASDYYYYYYNEDISNDSKKIEKTPACNAADLLYNCGFDDISINEGYTISTEYNKNLNDGNNIGSCIGSKTLTDGTTLVAIAIRGAGYGCEWIGDFEVYGSKGEHHGFQIASEKVRDHLKEYVKNNELTGKKIKIWITGYSRGAAVANLTAAYFCANGVTSCKCGSGDIYAYTFSTPRGTKSKSASSSIYNGIWNIVNPIDPVPMTAMKLWGYRRYGHTMHLPSVETRFFTYRKYSQDVLDVYRKQTGKGAFDLPQLPCQMYLYELLFDILAVKSGGDSSVYTLGIQTALQDHFRKSGVVGLLESLINVFKKVFTHTQDKEKPLTDSKQVYTLWDSIKSVPEGAFGAHYADTNFAWMSVIPANEVKENDLVSTILGNCPVDIAVYDQTGKLQLKIVNNQVIAEDNASVQAMVDDDGQKIICVPGDVQAKVEILATGDGEFNYSIQEDHLSDEVPTKLISYTPVKIKKGDTLTGTVSAGDANGNVTYHLTSQGKEVPLEATLSGDKAETMYLVSVVAEGNGKVSDNTYKKYGEFVEVVAEPGSGATFVGWYAGNNLLSKEKTYRHKVDKATALTAKFEGGSGVTKPAPAITNVYNSAKGGDIRWKKADGAIGYNVYRFRSADGEKKVATINDVNTVQCFDPAIKDNCYGRVYNYYVTALYKDSSGKTVESEPSDKLVLQRLAPMKITKVIQTNGTSVSLNWACTVNENKSYGYEVQYAEKNTDLYDRVGTFKAFPVEGRSNLTAAINGLKSGKKYWIRVRCYVNYTHSVTGALTKTWSQYSNIVTVNLSSVSNTTPTYQVTDSVTNYRSGIWIYWTPTNAKGYNVYRKTGANGQWQKIAYAVGQKAYRYHDAAVKDKNGVMYYYTVRGVIGSKLSDYDKNGRGILRLIPADFTKAENSAVGTVSLAWNKNNAATGYEVEYSKDKEFAEVISTVAVTPNTTVTTEIKGLETGTVYYFRARAYTVKGGDTYYGQWGSASSVRIVK